MKTTLNILLVGTFAVICCMIMTDNSFFPWVEDPSAGNLSADIEPAAVDINAIFPTNAPVVVNNSTRPTTVQLFGRYSVKNVRATDGADMLLKIDSETGLTYEYKEVTIGDATCNGWLQMNQDFLENVEYVRKIRPELFK